MFTYQQTGWPEATWETDARIIETILSWILFNAEIAMANSPILPYPDQLPQDYYAKNLPSAAPAPVIPGEPSIPEFVPPPEPGAAVNNGGIWYGDIPPDSPLNGWLWCNSQGQVFIYMDPGVWTQIGTNW